jgi:uncharacterized protein YecA (UPF0149 family)
MSSAEYPLGTVALYGPTDKLATKLVANVYRHKAQPPIAVKKWNSESLDIREDADIRAQLTAFLKQHNVARAVVTEEVVGCPHESGVDYPAGTNCPYCPFWANRQLAKAAANPKSTVPGRNDPCPCGSGKKYKKCCGE